MSLAQFALCEVLLRDEARFAWLVLVPRRPGLVELHDLGLPDRALLMEEVAKAGRVLKEVTKADKINTGALGNLVRQLHVHVVARRIGDAAWPGPVWGFGTRRAHERAALEALRVSLAAGLA